MMLINQIGVENDDDIALLENRRATPDPKNRETITTLLKISLSPVTRAERCANSHRVEATVTAFATSETESDEAARTDVA